MNAPNFYHLSKVWRKLWGVGLVVTMLSPVWAEDPAPSQSARPTHDARVMAPEMQERLSAMEGFRQNLEAAKTPEEKWAVMERWREQNRNRIEQRRAEAPPQSNPAEMVARMKEAAAGNPEMLSRAEQMEKRLQEVEKTKVILERIRQAEGEEKRKLMEELREERTKKARLIKLEMEALQKGRRPPGDERDTVAHPLPSEIQARLAEHEERKKAMDREQAMKALLEIQAESRRMDEQKPAPERSNSESKS